MYYNRQVVLHIIECEVPDEAFVYSKSGGRKRKVAENHSIYPEGHGNPAGPL